MYTMVLALVILLAVWRNLWLPPVLDMLSGSLIGTPLGAWVLGTVPASTRMRLIGVTLVLV